MRPHAPEVQAVRCRKWISRFEEFNEVVEKEFEKYARRTGVSPDIQQLKEEVFPKTKNGDTQNYEMLRVFYYLASKGLHPKLTIEDSIYVQSK